MIPIHVLWDKCVPHVGSEDGSFFVTAGERHVKFWRMDDKGQVRVAEDDLTEGVPTALGEAAR